MISRIFELQNPWRKELSHPFTLKNRGILETLLQNLDNDKMLGITGSRQVGKSSLLYLIINHLIKKNINPMNIFYFNLDDIKLQELFSDLSVFVDFLGNGQKRRYIFIDEVQRLENPGLFLKSLHDLNLDLKVIFSGSSHLELKSKIREHLVGRVRDFEVGRLSFEEYFNFSGPITRDELLNSILTFGSYPEVALEKNLVEKQLLIKDIFQSYIQKDIVDFLQVDNVSAFNKLLILLANQIGQLLNLDGLAKSLRISRAKTARYIELLEKTFIIKTIYPFFKNYGKEIIKTPKIYFMDLGLRNFILNNFNPLELRNDIGFLFENFYFLELYVRDVHKLKKINFWRTTNQTEIDFIISEGNSLEAFETKWNKVSQPRSFHSFLKHYPKARMKVVTRYDYS